MKAVTPDALGMKLVRDRIVVRERVMIAMEGGIEAGDLRQCRRIASSVLIGARLCGWCSGASETYRSSRATTPWSISTGRA